MIAIDDRHRQMRRELADDLHLAALARLLEGLDGDRAHLRFQLADRAWGEEARDELSVPRVLRQVLGDQQVGGRAGVLDRVAVTRDVTGRVEMRL
jgi:hypothetical protein